jgi:sugar phosphate permease
VAAVAVSRYRWTILGAGVVAQASFSAIFFGLPAIGPAIRAHYDLTLPEMGVVFASLNAGLVATLLLWGIVADRIGERAVLAVGLTGCGGAVAIAASTSSLAGLVAALAAAGALGGGTQTASGRAVMSWFGAEERGLALGIRQTAVPLGGSIAAVGLPALAEGAGVHAAFVALAAGCLVAAVVTGVLIRAEPSSRQAPVSRPLRDARIWRLCLGSVFYVTTQIALLGFLVLFLHDARDVSTTASAGVLAVVQVLGGAARIVVGRWSDRRLDRVTPLLRLGLLLTASATAAALLVHAPLWVVIPAFVVAGTLSLAWNGLSFTAAAEIAGRARAGAAIGLQQSFLAVGSLVTPIAFAAIVHASSWRVAFVVAALSPLVGYALLRGVRDQVSPVDRSFQTGRRQSRQP